MKKYLSLVMLVLAIFICGVHKIEAVYAMTNDEEPRPFEEIYPEIGYKTVEEAVMEFEQHFNQDLKLPLKIPPLSFTHHFGRFNDAYGDINDSFELMFSNDKSPENQYEIKVRPIIHKIPIKDARVVDQFTLKNGQEAKFINVSEAFEALVFERDNWQYMLTINKKISHKITPEILVDIANSIDYPSEKEDPFE